MFRSIGVVILLYAITQLFSALVVSFESAMVASFNTLETAAIISTQQLQNIK